ncbi:HAD family hydrolase [Micromonospora chokoriensis]
MKCFRILRDYRRATRTLADAASGSANLHTIILAGRPPAEPSLRRRHLRGPSRTVSNYPGITETLVALRRRGLPVVVLMGASTGSAQILLGAAGIEADRRRRCDQVDRPKPSADGMLLAARRLGAIPERLILVGDSPLDLQAAKAAGSSSASDSLGTSVRPARAADLTLSTPQQLLPLLDT